MDNNTSPKDENIFCASCGTQNLKIAKYCKKCGSPIITDTFSSETMTTISNVYSKDVITTNSSDSKPNKNIVIVCILVVALFIAVCLLGAIVYTGIKSNESKKSARIEEGEERESSRDKSDNDDVDFREQSEASIAEIEDNAENAKLAEKIEAEDEEETEAVEEESEVEEDEYDYYNKDFIFPDSDSRYLSENELYGFNKEQCVIARNEIYARHGRKFTTKEIQDYFETKDWYMPRIEAKNFKESMLNKYETANANMILAYEKDESNFTVEEIKGNGSQKSDYMSIDPLMLAGLYANETNKKAYISMSMYTDYDDMGDEVGNIEIDGRIGYVYRGDAKTIQVIMEDGETFDIKAYKKNGKVKIDILGNKQYDGTYIMVEHYES